MLARAIPAKMDLKSCFLMNKLLTFGTRYSKQEFNLLDLGARDTLRLEAGMNLYGTDMDTTTSPLASGLSWTVALQPEDREVHRS